LDHPAEFNCGFNQTVVLDTSTAFPPWMFLAASREEEDLSTEMDLTFEHVGRARA
jgi:hypothetical protein